jgi:hypothetical protein
MDRAQLEAAMSSLPQRTFLMRNVHDDAPVLLRTRWALSYLRGPLTTAEIARLEDVAPATGTSPSAPPETKPASTGDRAAAPATSPTNAGVRPVVPPGLHERFLAASGTSVEYEPRLGARVRTHFVDSRTGVDSWTEAYYLAPLDTGGPLWEQADICSTTALDLLEQPAPEAAFVNPPAGVLTAKAPQQFAKSLAEHVYRSSSLTVYRCPALKASAPVGATESEFRAQLAQTLREKRDAAVDALRRKYATRLDALADRQRRAEQRLQREKDQASSETMASAISVGSSLLGALFGGSRRSSAFGKAATAARSVGRIGKERGDVTHAAADAEALKRQHADLEAELETELAALEPGFDSTVIEVESVAVKPRKSDTAVTDVALVWQPA